MKSKEICCDCKAYFAPTDTRCCDSGRFFVFLGKKAVVENYDKNGILKLFSKKTGVFSGF